MTALPYPSSYPRAILYTRVSTAGQVDTGTSLAEQLAVCTRKADAIGAVVIRHCEDAGVSGGLYASRYALQDGLRIIESGEANTLIIANLSRFSRDREHQSAIKKRVEMAGGRLIFCDMDFADSDEGDLQFGIIGSFAHYERRLIRTRTMKGRRQRAEDGLQPSRTQIPYGYHVVTKNDVLTGAYTAEQIGTYQQIEAEADWVRTMFQKADAGMSLRSLAVYLNTHGAPLKARPWEKTGRTAKAWGHSSVYYILTNPVHKGAPIWGKTETLTDETRLLQGKSTVTFPRKTADSRQIVLSAPPIVSAELWQSVNDRLSTNRERLSGNPRRRYLLSAFLRCPECGSAMNGKTRQPHSSRNPTGEPITAYGCSAVIQRLTGEDGARLCRHGVEYPSAVMEAMFAEALGSVISEKTYIAASIRGYRRDQQNYASGQDGAARRQTEIEKLRRSLEALNAKERATITAQVASVGAGADPLLYIEALQELTRQKASLRSLLQEMEVTGGGLENIGDPLEISEALSSRAELVRKNLLSPLVPDQEKRSILEQFPSGTLGMIPEGKDGLRVGLTLFGKLYSSYKTPVQIVIRCRVGRNPEITLEGGVHHADPRE